MQIEYLAATFGASMIKLDDDKEKLRLVVAVVLATPLLMQMLYDMVGGGGFISMGILIVCATLLQLTISGFYYELFISLKKLKFSTEGLIAIATTALWGASTILWVENGVEVGAAYAGVNAVTIPIALYGRIIAEKIVSPLPKGRDDEFMMPRDASFKRPNGVFEKVPLAQIRQGDIIQVMQGEVCPVDCAIIEGSALFTCVELNADPMPHYRAKGDNVLAGEECFGGTVVVRAIRGGYESRLTDACSYARMESRYEQTSRFLDSFINPMALTIVIASLIVSLVWMGIDGTMNGLVLGLATLGLGVSAGFGLVSALPQFFGAEYLRTKGVLIHQADIVETARKINHLYTSPVDMFIMHNPKVASVHTDIDEDHVLALIYGMFKSLDHPLLLAVRLACELRGVKPAKLRKVFFDPSRGITAEYEGQQILLGNPALLSANGVGYYKFKTQVREMEGRGESVLWLAEGKPENECIGVISFMPILRSSANDAVERIKEQDISVDLLSQFTGSKHLNQLVGVKFSSVVEGKNSIQIYNSVVQAQVAKEKVAVAAFSPLDLPAAQAADLTIMSSTGPSMLMSYAAITLSNPDPERLASAMIVTKTIGDKVVRNITISVGFSALALILGLFNFLSPMVAAVITIASVALIVTNSYLIKNVQ